MGFSPSTFLWPWKDSHSIIWWLDYSLNPQWVSLELTDFLCWFPALLELSWVLCVWTTGLLQSQEQSSMLSLLSGASRRRIEEQDLCHIPVSNVFLPVTSSLPCQGETGLVTLCTCSLKTPQTQCTCSPLVSWAQPVILWSWACL